MSRRKERKAAHKDQALQVQQDMLTLSMTIKMHIFPMREADLAASSEFLRSAGANIDEFAAFFRQKLQDTPVGKLGDAYILNAAYLFICHKIGSTRLSTLLFDESLKYGDIRQELDAFKPKTGEPSSFWKFMDRVVEEQIAPKIILGGK